MDKKNSEGGKYGSGVSLKGYDTDYSSEKIALKEKKKNEPEEEKQASKRARPSRKKLKKFLIVLAVIAVCFLITRLPFFNIKYIDIKDNRMFTDEAVIAASKISIGDNIFDHRGSQIKKNISSEIPYMVDVKVKRQLPDRLVITVKENSPVLAIPYKNKFLILDKNGKVIEKADSVLTATRVDGLEVKKAKIGEKLKAGNKFDLEQALKVAADANDAGMFFKSIDVSSNLSITAYVTDTIGCTGDAIDIRNNLDGIKALLYDIDQKGYTSGTIYIGDDDYATFSRS